MIKLRITMGLWMLVSSKSPPMSHPLSLRSVLWSGSLWISSLGRQKFRSLDDKVKIPMWPQLLFPLSCLLWPVASIKRWLLLAACNFVIPLPCLVQSMANMLSAEQLMSLTFCHMYTLQVCPVATTYIQMLIISTAPHIGPYYTTYSEELMLL